MLSINQHFSLTFNWQGVESQILQTNDLAVFTPLANRRGTDLAGQAVQQTVPVRYINYPS